MIRYRDEVGIDNYPRAFTLRLPCTGGYEGTDQC